jgi:glycosyltransferase involved in cell wall biosynthesis
LIGTVVLSGIAAAFLGNRRILGTGTETSEQLTIGRAPCTHGYMDFRDRLAMVGGFVKVAPSAPHGTGHSAYLLCDAIARTGRYQAIDVFHENVNRFGGGSPRSVSLPIDLPCRLLERTQLKGAEGDYSAIYVANGEQMEYAAHLLRPDQDPAPVICEIGTAHYPSQWTNLFMTAWSGGLRDSDGFIFKSRSAERLFRRVWQEWSPRTGPLPFPTSTVIPNGIDVAANRRNERLRADTRLQLGLGADDVVFLTFSRLSPGTKGDHRALLFLWKRLLEDCPRAVLVMSGAVSDRRFLLQLRTAARATEIANRVLILDNPYELWSNARERLMSAADVFVHLTTGVEEVWPMAALEASAFGLPLIASDWAGLPELVEAGTSGFLIPTHLSDPPPFLQRMMLARTSSQANVDLSRCAGCDGTAFLAAARVLAEQAERRRAMGAQSRRRAESLFNLADVARRRVDFFDVLAEAARDPARATESRPPLMDLVSFRSVLWSQGRRPLSPDDVVIVCRADLFDRFRETQAAQAGHSLQDAVEDILCQGSPMTAAELTRRVESRISGHAAGDGEPAGDPEAWRACARILVRLIAHGVVRLVDTEDPAQQVTA